MSNESNIIKAIGKSVSRDLLSAEWRKRVSPDAPAVAGHCAISAEAFYYLVGGKDAGFKPNVCSYYKGLRGALYFDDSKKPNSAQKSTHWWVRGPDGAVRGEGQIFDPTKAQYDQPFPYEFGRAVGFMQPQKIPSKRAQIIMDRVIERLGADTIRNTQSENIERFQTALKLGG